MGEAELLGVHKQKQEGLNWVGVSVPSGRLQAEDMEVGVVSVVKFK
jgi:sulfite reductase beta subunit-like hemoprotein